jgi:glycosyltransferase involved in cell wall biosynthesis
MVFWTTDETEPGLLERVERAGRDLDNLELSGKLPRERVTELIARAPAVVSTSEAEGMPNVFLEAWARAVPVLSLDYDPDGLIESEGLGLVAHDGQEELARAAASLWADPDLRARLGLAGREHVIAQHSPEAVGARWAEAIRGLTGS